MKQAAAEIAVLPTDGGDNARLIMRCIRNRSASAATAARELWEEEISRRVKFENALTHVIIAGDMRHETNWKLADMKTDDMQRALVRSTCC